MKRDTYKYQVEWTTKEQKAWTPYSRIYDNDKEAWEEYWKALSDSRCTQAKIIKMTTRYEDYKVSNYKWAI